MSGKRAERRLPYVVPKYLGDTLTTSVTEVGLELKPSVVIYNSEPSASTPKIQNAPCDASGVLIYRF